MSSLPDISSGVPKKQIFLSASTAILLAMRKADLISCVTTTLVTLGLIAAHGGVLLLDGYLRPSLAGVTLPFALGYHPYFAVPLDGVRFTASFGGIFNQVNEKNF